MNIETGEDKKELLFSGGAGAVSYQFGYTQYVLEIVGKEKLREYAIGGVSCGACCSIALYTSLYLPEQYDMRYWYEVHAREFFGPENMKYFGIGTTGTLINKLSKKIWEIGIENNVPTPNGRYHVLAGEFEGFSLKRRIVDNFEDASDYAEAMRASCYLPVLVGFGMYTSYKGKKMIDGGFTREVPYKYPKSKKIFLTLFPDKSPYYKEIPENTSVLNIHEPYNLSFPSDYWHWKVSWGDEMFLKGYLAAIQQREEILKAFEVKTM